MTLDMLDFEHDGRQMTFEDLDISVYIEMEDDSDMKWDWPFWLEKDDAYKLFEWLGEWLGIDWRA